MLHFTEQAAAITATVTAAMLSGRQCWPSELTLSMTVAYSSSLEA